jgi:hypothetical protein
MLRIVEYSLLAVSLLVVIGLIMSGSRSDSESPGGQPPALAGDGPEAQEPGKAQ